MSRKTAMEITAAKQLGYEMRLAGWNRDQVINFLEAEGFRKDGVTARRLFNGYNS